MNTYAQNWKELDFKTTLEKHVNSISTKNIDVINATVADSVLLIFPDGEILKSKQKFVALHLDWFKDPNWKMTTEILQIKEDKTLAHGLVKYQLTNYNTDGSTKSIANTYLLLIFEKQKEGWKLIHDQNTKTTK
jgi:ketosteroid isomerase-like protein